MKDFEATCMITHINLRKEGKDNDALYIDLKLNAILDADICDNLMCEDVNDGDALKAFWLQNESGDPRFFIMGEVKFERAFENVTLKIESLNMEFKGSKLSKFCFTPLKEHKANMEFSATIRPVTNNGDVEKLSEYYKKDELLMEFSIAQAEMFAGNPNATVEKITQ